MGRGSYAKQLTGQISRRMPVLKPAMPPFYRRFVPELTVSSREADAVPSVSQVVRDSTPQDAGATSSTESSDRTRRFQPNSDLRESQFLNPPPVRAENPAEKAEIIHPGDAQPILKPGVGESRTNITIRTSDDPKIDLRTPNLHSTPPRAGLGPRQEQKRILESKTAVSRRTSVERSLTVAPLIGAGETKESIREASPPTEQTKSSEMPSTKPSLIELRKVSKAKPARSQISAPDLQPRKNSIEKDVLAAAVQFETRSSQGGTTARGRRQESQRRRAGGVHIGSLEVRIVPATPPPAPIIKPAQARPAPATALSRSLTSSLGLSQG